MDWYKYWIISYEYIRELDLFMIRMGESYLGLPSDKFHVLYFGLTMFSLLLLILVACMNRNVVACACVALLYVY